MKQVLRKTIKASFASIVAIKAADLYRSHTQPMSLVNLRKPAQAEDNNDTLDIISLMKRKEFTKDISYIPYEYTARYTFKLKSREEHLKEMQDAKTNYDLLIIGGGASGAGVALEAASRGLKCAVVEKYDFASGTSSRSTKMAHGGIRYFEKMAKLEGDPFENYHLLKETLNERNYFLHAAPF